MVDLDEACQVLHEAYERAAARHNWRTNPDSRVPWADVPEANKATMRVAVSELLGWMFVAPQRPVVAVGARVVDEPDPAWVEQLREAVIDQALIRTRALSAARHALMALRQYAGVPENAVSHGTPITVGCVTDDLGKMGDALRAHFLGEQS